SNIEKASKEEENLFNLAAKYEQSGDLLNLRHSYQQIIEKFPSSTNIGKAQEGLENTNVRILFSPISTPDSISYEIQKGDTLAKIAKKFSNTQDMIMKANGLRNPSIVPLGKKIKVHNEKFNIIVDKSQNILTLKSADKVIKTYHVSTGLNNSTPVGNFKIINKIVDPPWYTAGTVIQPDSPKNILGTRWLGLSAQGYGIHGTTEPQSIGKQVTSGCIRMKNIEVEELYQIVPEGTEVVIVD
ncbi:MAG: L,D-transpeptidase family protein, partial [Candidatus Omnitrophota bacterium]